MIALRCFFLRLLASPFKSTSRLEAENAALRHQLIALRRKVRGHLAFGGVSQKLLWRMHRVITLPSVPLPSITHHTKV
jgi:hypothetical protein